MIRDITLGQYYPGKSLVHKLDPRITIIGTFIYIISLFIVNNMWGFLIEGAVLFAVVKISKVPFKFMLKGLKPIFFIIAFTFVLNIFMNDGEILWQWKFLKITNEGLYRAFFMAIRLILLILGTSVLTLTTKPINLTDGIEHLLKPFKKIGLPASEIAMMMTIALRFIPTLLEETDKIMKAQLARGADFETGSLWKRINGMIPILVPLFVSALRIANDLAMAMESRGYKGGEGRTRMVPMKIKKGDFVAIGLIVIFLVGIIVQSYYVGIYKMLGIMGIA